MRSLTFFWVIMMMTMSITSVIAQKYMNITDTTLQTSDSLEKDEVWLTGKTKITGYSDLIFSVTTETLEETWTKSDSGVVYSTRVVSGKQTAWWMIFAIFSIVRIILAQKSETYLVIAFIAIMAAFFSIVVVFSAIPFAATTTIIVALYFAIMAGFIAFGIFISCEKHPIPYVCTAVCMMIHIIFMYCAF